VVEARIGATEQPLSCCVHHPIRENFPHHLYNDEETALNVAPPVDQGPTGRGDPGRGWRRVPRGVARRLRDLSRRNRTAAAQSHRPHAPALTGVEEPPVAIPSTAPVSEPAEPDPDPKVGTSTLAETQPASVVETVAPKARGWRLPGRWGWLRHGRVLVRIQVVSLVVCLALSVAMFWHMWQDPTHRLLGSGLGDGALMMWFLRWTPAAIGHGMNPLFSDYLNFPTGVNVMWNTSLLLPGFLLAPITVTWGPVVTFNLLGTLGPALSGWTATLAFRRYVRSGLAALIGGLVFGFSPYMLAQNRGHLQLTLLFLVPLLFLVVDNILTRQRRAAWVSGAALGILAGLQILVGEEVFALVAIMLAAQVVIMALMFPRHVPAKLPYAAIAFGTAAVVFIAIAGYAIWFQLFGPQHVNGDLHGGDRLATDLWNLITPTSVQAVVPASAKRITATFTGNVAETNGYISIPLILIVLFTAARWAWSRTVVRVAFLMALLSVVLSMGNHLHIRGRVTDVALPWNALKHLPLLESAAPNRFMLVGMLFCALLLAVFIDQSLRWRWSERAPVALLVIAVMVALAPRLPLHGGQLLAPPFFTNGMVERVPQDSTVLVAPYPTPSSATPMTWQAVAKLRYRMPGGYFVGPQPNGEPRYGAPLNRLADQLNKLNSGWNPPKMDPYRRLTYTYNLVQWRVGTVVVGPMRNELHRANTVTMFTQLLGRPPSREGGVDVWWDVKPQRLMDQAARALR
jgi:hypothetical protein